MTNIVDPDEMAHYEPSHPTVCKSICFDLQGREIKVVQLMLFSLSLSSSSSSSSLFACLFCCCCCCCFVVVVVVLSKYCVMFSLDKAWQKVCPY